MGRESLELPKGPFDRRDDVVFEALAPARNGPSRPAFDRDASGLVGAAVDLYPSCGQRLCQESCTDPRFDSGDGFGRPVLAGDVDRELVALRQGGKTP